MDLLTAGPDHLGRWRNHEPGEQGGSDPSRRWWTVLTLLVMRRSSVRFRWAALFETCRHQAFQPGTWSSLSSSSSSSGSDVPEMSRVPEEPGSLPQVGIHHVAIQ